MLLFCNRIKIKSLRNNNRENNMNKKRILIHKHLANILYDSDNIQYLMYILDKYFEQEMEHSISVE